MQALREVTAEGRKVAELLKGAERSRLLALCDEIDALANQLADLQRRGLVCYRIYLDAHSIALGLRSKFLI